MTHVSNIAAPWQMIVGDTREFVYVIDANDEQIVRMAYGQRETAAYIVSCVNAAERKNQSCGTLIGALCASNGDANLLADSEGGTCD